MTDNVIKKLLKEVNNENQKGIYIDLISKVREIMTICGLVDNIEYFDNNYHIKDNKDKPIEFQRHGLNKFWTVQLLTLDKDTSDERYSLINIGTAYDWVVNFIKEVLPTIITYKLPIRIN